MNKFVPESVLDKLVVGARVRYIPNYECKFLPQVYSAAHDYGANLHEAELDAENQTGIIRSTSDTEFAGHPYLVEMDVQFRFAGTTFQAVTLAADELALVEDEA